MNRIGRDLLIILRAEQLIARRRMAVMRARTGILAVAGLIAGMGLIMLNVAAFLALETYLSGTNAALVVALANLSLGLILTVVAHRVSADRELEQVTELRDLAIEDLETELHDAARQARELADNVRRIAHDPLSTIAPSLAAPVLGLLLRLARRSDKAQPTRDEQAPQVADRDPRDTEA